MLDPVQNHALLLCLGAFRTSPSSSLCILANEPPLHLRRQNLSIQYCLRLSSTSQNSAYSAVFNSKFKPSFQCKPNQIPPLGIRIHSHLQAVGFRRKDTLQCQHRLGFSTILTPTTAYTLFIKMILHLKSSGITSKSYVQTINTAKWMMEWPRWLFGKNCAKLFAYQATQASLEQNSVQSAWHLTLSVSAEIRTSSSSLTLSLVCWL